MTMIASPSRREFLVNLKALGGLVLVASVSDLVKAEEKYGADGMPHGWSDNPLIFVAIDGDGTVTIVVHRSEMGQGVRTGMPLIVADELEADWSRVRVTQAPADEGSTAIRIRMDPGAHAIFRAHAPCVAARTMLEQAAAHVWNVPVAQSARRQPRSHPRGKRTKAGLRRWRNAPRNCRCLRAIPCLKSPAQFLYIGKETPLA
jgi:isoquinoline 1-oxidoreductase beta subunit